MKNNTCTTCKYNQGCSILNEFNGAQRKLFLEVGWGCNKWRTMLEKGTICWVWREDCPEVKYLRVADGQGKFYDHGKADGTISSWDSYETILEKENET